MPQKVMGILSTFFCETQLNAALHKSRIAVQSQCSMNTEMCEHKNTEREVCHGHKNRETHL